MATRPKTGGRKKGTPNKRTQALEAALKSMAYEVGKAIPNAFKGNGVAFLVAVYKDPSLPLDMRLDAAAKAARFEQPMLQAIEHSGNSNKPVQHKVIVELVRPPERK